MSDVVPKDLQAPKIMLLRASVTSARKGLDDITAEIEDQVVLIKTAKGKDTPDSALMQFKKSLKDLIENGDKLLTTNNGSLSEKLELLLLKFETSETIEQFNKVKSLRDKLVGEAIPYRGRFRSSRLSMKGCYLGCGKLRAHLGLQAHLLLWCSHASEKSMTS